MYGVIDYYRAAREAGIHRFYRCGVYIAPTNSRYDREAGGGDDLYYHLVLLAERVQSGISESDERSYFNEIFLVSRLVFFAFTFCSRITQARVYDQPVVNPTFLDGGSFFIVLSARINRITSSLPSDSLRSPYNPSRTAFVLFLVRKLDHS